MRNIYRTEGVLNVCYGMDGRLIDTYIVKYKYGQAGRDGMGWWIDWRE